MIQLVTMLTAGLVLAALMLAASQAMTAAGQRLGSGQPLGAESGCWWTGFRVGRLLGQGLLLGLLTLLVCQTAWLTAFDSWFNHALAWLRQPGTLDVADFVSHLGGDDARRWVPLVLAVILLVTRNWGYIPGLVLTTLATEYGSEWFKQLVDRPRPEFLTDKTASSPSFPSRHTAGATMVFGLLGYLLAQFWPRWRGVLIYMPCFFATVMGLARMLLSVHYLSDVVAGMLLGNICLLLGMGLNTVIRAGRAGSAG